MAPFSTLSADTFYLNDGSIVEGSIISETKRSYLLRAEISRNVYDEKTILKLDVTRHVAEDPSVKAFAKISKILPTPDLMPVTNYATIIDKQLKPFIRTYPDSEHLAEVQEILQTLESEQTIILAGGMKLDGILLNEQEVAADKYEVSASIDLKKFLKFAQKKQYRPALSKLKEMEELYPNSSQVRKAQKVALTILPHYKKELEVLLSEVDELTRRRERTLDSMSASDRRRTEEIFMNKEKQYDNRLATMKAERGAVTWLPINAFNKGPIEANLQMVPKEITRISSESQKPAMKAGVLYRSTLQALDSGNLAKAIELHTQFKAERPSAMFANSLEMIFNDQKKVLEEMKKKADAIKMTEAKRMAEERMAKRKAEEAKQAASGNKDDKGKALLNKVIGSKNRQLEESLKQ